MGNLDLKLLFKSPYKAKKDSYKKSQGLKWE